jgi:hypothetical protein
MGRLIYEPLHILVQLLTAGHDDFSCWKLQSGDPSVTVQVNRLNGERKMFPQGCGHASSLQQQMVLLLT